ncbi:MAG: NAD(P)/FAD-dependent oxidoreductase [Candidatus Ranarchaeia archaeon]
MILLSSEGGPAGLSAAMHLAFQKRKVLVLDRRTSPMNFYTNPVNNYPGVLPLKTGREVLHKIRDDAKSMGTIIAKANVTRVDGEFPMFYVHAKPLARDENEQIYKAKTVIFATGVARKHPRVKGDWRKWLPFAGKNCISFYCPDCEAPLTTGKDILVVNAGTVNSALYIANYIKPFAKSVKIFMTEDAYVPLQKGATEKLDASGFEWYKGYIEKNNNSETPGRTVPDYTYR